MPSILKRIFNISKLYINDYNSSSFVEEMLNSDENELKKQINNLNNKQNNYTETKQKVENKINHKEKALLDKLSLNINATNEDIKNAYRKLIKENHPDKFADTGNSKFYENKTRELNDAFAELKKIRGFK